MNKIFLFVSRAKIVDTSTFTCSFIKGRFSYWFRSICWVVLITFGSNMIGEDAARAWSIAEPQNIIMPIPGSLIPGSPDFSLPTLKAISIDANDPFKIDFVVDGADQNLSKKVGQEQVNLLIKYFLSFLTIPQEDLWVNLSPYEKNRIIIPTFESTNAGRDMLEEDYILKQLASSLTYPDHELGKVFWKRVYNRVQAEYGSLDIPVTSFNKVWVVPDKVIVYEGNGSAFISQSRLKVLTEEDYLSIEKNRHRQHMPSSKIQKIDHISSEITREIIIPELEREVNEGKYFAPLRQMYNSLILAIWFKKEFKGHLIGQVYVNQKKIAGISLGEKQIKEKIYAQYIRAFKKGAYNYIKEEEDPLSNEMIPRKYFSGGFSFAMTAKHITFLPASGLVGIHDRSSVFGKGMYSFAMLLKPIGISKAKLMSLVAGASLFMGGINEAHAQTRAAPDAQKGWVHALSQNTLKEGEQKRKKGDVIGWLGAQIFGGVEGIVGIPVDYTGQSVQRVVTPWTPQEKKVSMTKGNYYDPRFIGDFAGHVFLGPVPDNSPAPSISVTPSAVERKKENQRPKPQIIPLKPAPKFLMIATDLHPSMEQGVLAVTPITITAPPTTAPATTAPAPSTAVPTVEISVKQPHSSQDHVEARGTGEIAEFDSLKEEYEKGEKMGVISNPDLDKRIAELSEKVRISKETYEGLIGLVSSGLPTLEQIATAKGVFYDLSLQLQKAQEEKAAHVIYAPHKLRVKIRHVANGKQVRPGDPIIEYSDLERYQVDFTLPSGVNFLGDIWGLTLNGVQAQSIVSGTYSLVDPLQRTAQVSMVIDIAGASVHPGENKMVATIAPPRTDGKLDTIVGHEHPALAFVSDIPEDHYRAPVDGPVKYLVNVGDQVQNGEVLAEAPLGPYLEKLKTIQLAIQVLELQLASAADGDVQLNFDEVAKLKSKMAQMKAERDQTLTEIKSLQIRATQSGVVRKLPGAYHTGVFAKGDEVVTVGTPVLIGGANNVTTPILFPQEVKININDPVLVRTPQGSLPGKVTDINLTPQSPTGIWSGYQALEVMVFDHRGILQKNLPVRIVLAKTPNEKKIIQDALNEAAASSGGSAGGEPPSSVPDQVLALLQVKPTATMPSTTNAVDTGLSLATSPTDSRQFLVGLTGVEYLVRNHINLGAEDANVRDKVLHKQLVRKTAFSFTGEITYQRGKGFGFVGGAAGEVQSLIGGSWQKGSAYGAVPEVANVLVQNVFDLVTDKVGKQEALAQHAADEATQHRETVAQHITKLGQVLLIEIGITQEEIELLKAKQFYLEKTKSQLEAGISSKYTLPAQVAQVQRQIDDTIAKRKELERKLALDRVDLNALMVQPAHQPIVALLPEIEYRAITPQEREDNLRILTGPNSPNPRMKEWEAKQVGVEGALKLHLLEFLPIFTLFGVDTTSPQNYPFNQSANQYILNDHNLATGPNIAGSFNVPVYNSGTNTVHQIIINARGEVQNEGVVLMVELNKEYNETEASINGLSEEIQKAQEAYQHACEAWKNKAHDSYSVSGSLERMYQEFMAMVDAKEKLIVLQKQYLQRRADLRELCVEGREKTRKSRNSRSPTEAISSFEHDVSTSVRGAIQRDLTVLTSPVSLPAYTAPESSTLRPVGTRPLGAGVVDYQFGDRDVSSVWASMHRGPSGSGVSSPLEMMKDGLADSNPSVRTAALHDILTNYQNDPRFYPVLKEEVLAPDTKPDVVWGILKFMSQQKSHGVLFHVQVILKAQAQNNQPLADLSFRSLGDILALHPDVGQYLRPSDISNADTVLYPDVSIVSTNRVFVSYLLREPEGSIGKEMFFLSDFWTADQLAKIYNELTAYVDNHPNQPGIDKIDALAKTFYHWILKKAAIAKIKDAFDPANFDHLKIGLDTDLRNAVLLSLLPEWNTQYVYLSPTQDMGPVNPRLLASATETLNNLVSNNLSSGSILNTTAGQPPVHVSSSGVERNEFENFFVLSFDEQKPLISSPTSTFHIYELARILTYNPPFVKPSSLVPLRAYVLTHLMNMKDFQGRFLVLRDYLDSTDPAFIQLIESQAWGPVLEEDINHVKDAANMKILRESLEKFKKPWASDLRWKTFSPLEFRSARERGEAGIVAQEKVEAIKVGIEIFKQKAHYRGWGFRAGEERLTSGEIQGLKDAAKEFADEINPGKINQWFEDRARNHPDPKVREMFTYILKVGRDPVVVKMDNNDQSFPSFTLQDRIAALLLSPLVLLPFLRKLYHMIWWRSVSRRRKVRGLFIRSFGNGPLSGSNGSNGNNGNSAMLTSNPAAILISNGNNAMLAAATSGKSPKKEDFPISSPDKLEVVPDILKELKGWYNVVYKWDRDKDVSVEDLLKDLNIIDTYSDTVLLRLPYTPELMRPSRGQKPKNSVYQDTFSYINDISLTTLDVLAEHLKDKTLTNLQKRKLKLAIKRLFQKLNYSRKYTRILSHRGSIDKMMSYKFPDNQWMERIGLYPLERIIFLYQAVYKISEKRIEDELPALLEEGNLLYRGLYGDIPSILEESKERVSKVIKEARTSSRDIQGAERIDLRYQNFNGRSLGFIGVVFELAAALSPFINIPLLSTFTEGLSLAGYIFLFLTLGRYWKPHISLLWLGSDRYTVSLTNELKGAFTNLLSPSEIDQKISQEDHDREIVSIAKEEGALAIQEELRDESVDAIVLVADNKNAIPDLEDYKRRRLGNLIGNKTQVFVLTSQRQGDANVYLDVANQAKTLFNSHTRSWEDSVVMFVSNGQDPSTHQIYPDSFLDTAITNGVRVARNGTLQGSPVTHKPVQILIDASEPYFGSLPKSPDSGIVYLTSDVNSKVLSQTSLVNTRLTARGGSEVVEILKNLDTEKLKKEQEISFQFQAADFNPGEAQQLVDAIETHARQKGLRALPGGANAFERLNNLIKDPDSWEILGGEYQLDPEETREKLEKDYPETPRRLEEPREGKMIHFVRKRWLLDRPDLEQYPAIGAITLIGPDVARVYEKVRQNIEANHAWDLKRDKIADLDVPVVMSKVYGKRAKDELIDYVAQRIQWPDLRGVSELGDYTPLQERVELDYKFINQGVAGIGKITSYMPSSSGVLFRFNITAPQAELVRYQAVVASSAMGTTSTKGGIDLSGTKDIIQFNHHENGSSVKSQTPSFSPPSASLKSFQGFAFQVIEYQPISNPEELFFGSSVEKGGPWFSSQVRSVNHDLV